MDKKNDEGAFDLEPVVYGNVTFYGQKVVKFKDVPLSDDEIKAQKDAGMSEDMIPKTKSVIDDSVPPRYDDITQLFIDNPNLKAGQAQLLVQNAKLQMMNNQLTQGQAQLLSNIAKSQLENTQLKQQQAMLLSQLAKMKG
ncbi:hypothetical protein, partial [Apilactobacillus xinyiensis]|uniref:hypothetical protein n=1 Tax=Apilactobacillus xinyiensis TaxID=2841032 RepID=UPI001C7CAEB1